jgi:glycosyltransferase involved in cell wall biosynthesis
MSMEMAGPIVSVIICTRDRAEDLRQTLVAIAHLCVPDTMPAELVVVDNASTDGTATLVRESRLPNMPVRYVFEGRGGKGYAYNAGMAAAQGGVLLFTDDDVRPPRDWIAGMAGPILRGQVDAVAGGVRMAHHLARPWMWVGLRGAMADTDHLDAEAPQNLIGANMAFSRSVLKKVPAFDPELGPGALGFADEVLFSYQLKAAGFRIGSALDVVVEHHFDPARLTRESLLKAAGKHGRSQAYLAHHWDHKVISLPQGRLAKCALRLAVQRVRHRRTPASAEGLARWEFEGTAIIEFYRGYLCEQRRSRVYDKHGLMKRTEI